MYKSVRFHKKKETLTFETPCFEIKIITAPNKRIAILMANNYFTSL